MSVVIESSGPMAAQGDFDAQWDAAREGRAESPDPPSDAPVAPEVPQAPAPVTDQTQAQGQFQLSPEYQERVRQTGAQNLDEVIQYARQFQSLKGQLPNLEEQWRQKHLSPVEQELAALREERRLAIADFVATDPRTGQPRTAQQQAQVRAALDAEQQQQQAAEQKSQQEQQLASREQQVGVAEDALLRHGITTSINDYKADLAKQHNIPVSAIDTYMQQTRYMERLKDMPDLRLFGHFVSELGTQAGLLATSLQEQKAAAAAPKYRDVNGGPGGQGGQGAGQRWDRATDSDFEKAWEAAKENRLT